jgi:uncharacterized protein YndB with AHSA1/START domain
LVLLSLEQDVRVGGGYRLVLGLVDSKTMAFFGKYIEVVPPSRLSWTTKEALDRNIGSTEGLPEQFAQLDTLLPTLV